jgi:hypothetical protein
MKGTYACVFAISLFLMSGMVNAQSPQAVMKAPPVSQPLVREGDFAVKLVEMLKMGTAKDEAEAESLLASSGIAPRNGWIADYPVTPDVIAELNKTVSEAADTKRVPMGREEALKVLRTVAVELELPIVVDIPGGYAAAQPPKSPEFTEPKVVDNYYYNEGPPVVTYYPPPWDYAYLYTWVPSPFFFDTFFFPGFFILVDFHKIIIINKRVVVVTNHIIDPKTKTVSVIDPVKRGGGGVRTAMDRFRGRGFTSIETRKAAASIFERSRHRMRTATGPMERGRINKRFMSPRSGSGFREGDSPTFRDRVPMRGGGRSFSPPPTGRGTSSRISHAGGGSFGHAAFSQGSCAGRC